jgi:3-oxoacyl-[acyl-carrier-protein] synthase II
MASSRAALRQARLEGPAVGREEIGFFAGLGAVDYDVDDLLPAVSASGSPEGALDYRAFFLEHHRKIHPLWLLSQLNNIAFCQVAIALDIRGENAVLSQHGDAGAQAIAEGFHAVREGRVRIALVGGTGEEVTPNSLARYLLLGVLSARSGGQCRPFAADRSGAVLGEGGGALVLEHRSSAAARGVPSLAEVGGIGSACELAGPGTAPTAAAIGKAMTIACSEAGVGPEAIDLIIAHGDGTPAGDANEAVAIEELFGSALDTVGVLSVKGALGHLLAGAPLLDAALGACMLRHGVCPGMATDLAPDPNFGLPLLTGGPTARPLRRILINARGLAGQCVSLVLAAGARPD